VDSKFINNHKSSEKAFSRVRKLPFIDVFLLVLRNSVKSLQLMLNEFVLHAKKEYLITASAFTQARKKLKHGAFIELNDDMIFLYYKEKPYKKYLGFRILGFDGSKLALPQNEEIKIEFGSKAIGNHTKQELGEYSSGTFEVCYDVLNNIAVRSVLAKGLSYEVDLANKMLDEIKQDDLLIYDRGYASYEFMSELNKSKLNYIIRCSKRSFIPVRNMFNDDSLSDFTYTIGAPKQHIKRLRELGYPLKIKVRLVKVILLSGKVEILATSLLSEREFKKEEFQKLYFLRWGVETFFSKLKGRLNLENFTGKSVESVKQDFWSTIFISNLETIVTEDIEESLNEDIKNNRHKQKINKSVSFNAIKNLAFEILSTNQNKDRVIERLTKLFLVNTQVVRDGRKVPRYKISDTQSLNYQKRLRKHVF
jgi:hypothetical protein